MRTALYLQAPIGGAIAALKFAGARHRLEAAGYGVRKIPVTDWKPRELSALADFWQADGMVIDCRGRRPPVGERFRSSVPIVYLDIARAFETPARASVSYDIRETCRLAARELLSLDCAAYGYAGYGKAVSWSDERCRVFARAIALNGHALETFELDPASVSTSTFYGRLKRWMLGVPKPFGIFAADDAYALPVHSVAQNLKLRMPADIAILGVDNESPQLGIPGLSSIQLDFQDAGRQAAELLLEKIASPRVHHANRHFGPVQLLRRSSTRKLKYRQDKLENVLRRIREQALDGLTAKKVASWMPGSRRLSELTFRRATGHSILEEITAVRIGRAKELLSDTHLTIGEIANLCGYRTFNAFRNAFKISTGLTPRDWRKRG